jgi:hypothetical protein
VPVVELPPVTPFTCQVTAVFTLPVTVALNDAVAPARTSALEGETLTVTLGFEGGGLEVPVVEPEELFVVPVQPATAAAHSRHARNDKRRKTSLCSVVIERRIGSAL